VNTGRSAIAPAAGATRTRVRSTPEPHQQQPSVRRPRQSPAPSRHPPRSARRASGVDVADDHAAARVDPRERVRRARPPRGAGGRDGRREQPRRRPVARRDPEAARAPVGTR
jgi:hypothetical protein